MQAYKVYEFVQKKSLRNSIKIGHNYWTIKPGNLLKPKRNMGLTKTTGKVTGILSGNYIYEKSLLFITDVEDINDKLRKFTYIQLYPQLLKEIPIDKIQEIQKTFRNPNLSYIEKMHEIRQIKYHGIYFKNYPLLMKEKQFNNRFKIFEF